MKRLLFTNGLLFGVSAVTFAGGLLTNTNQNVAFLRNPSRDAAIAIDGVVSNPAGVVFLKDGIHLSVNIQNAHQTRDVTSTFGPFVYGDGNTGTTKKYRGKADAPIESTVAMLPLLSRSLPSMAEGMGLGTIEGMPLIDNYKMDTYMRGRQYYYGFTLGAARKINDNLSVYAGVRGLYGTSNYYGYVRDIQVKVGDNWLPASETFKKYSLASAQAYGVATEQAKEAMAGNKAEDAAEYAAKAKDAYTKAVLYQALGTATEDVTLNCDQWGLGFAPIMGIDYKVGNFNFAAKYEFKTRMRLHNKSANSASAENIAVLAKYKDGQKVEDDSPALLTVGAQWEIIPSLRVSAGWHHFFDKAGHMYEHHEQKLGGDTNEYLAGVEYDINKAIQASCGFQKTCYDFTDDYMEDISFNVSSWTFGVGVGIKLKENMKLNLAYFQTNYGDYTTATTNDFNNQSAVAAGIIAPVVAKLTESEEMGAMAAQAAKTALVNSGSLAGSNSFTRTNRVLGIGFDISF